MDFRETSGCKVSSYLAILQAVEQAGQMAKLIASFLESFTDVVAKNAGGFLDVRVHTFSFKCRCIK